MIEFSPEQIEALREVQHLCADLGAEPVIIGATAYRIWITDSRQTEDIDLSVSLDLDDFAQLGARLTQRGWQQDARREHRWYSPARVRVDLLPAGPRLRAEGRIQWPASQMTMRLLGFEHVFQASLPVPIGTDLTVKVVPVTVFTLLKIVAWLDAREARRKDLQDLVNVLSRYELDSEKRFCDEVFDAKLGFDEAGAFLLGQDLRSLCTREESVAVVEFIGMMRNSDAAPFRHFVGGISAAAMSGVEGKEEAGSRLLEAFALGFSGLSSERRAIST